MMNDETFINDLNTVKQKRDRYQGLIDVAKSADERSNIISEANDALTRDAAMLASNYPNYGESERVAVKAAIELDTGDQGRKELDTRDRQVSKLNSKTIGTSSKLSSDVESVLSGSEHDKEVALRQWAHLSDAGAKDAVRFEYITRSVLPRLVALVSTHGKQAVLASNKILGKFDSLIFPKSPGWAKTWLSAQPDTTTELEEAMSDARVISAINNINKFIEKDQFGRASAEAKTVLDAISNGELSATRQDYIFLYDTSNM